MAVLNFVEKKFDKAITFDDMKTAVTVEDLYNIIIAK